MRLNLYLLHAYTNLNLKHYFKNSYLEYFLISVQWFLVRNFDNWKHYIAKRKKPVSNNYFTILMISPFHHATGLFLYPMKISVKFLIKLQTTLFSHLTESHSIHSKKKNDLYYLEYFISLVVKNIVAVFEKNIKVA